MAEYLVPKGYPNELVEKLLGAAFTVESSFHEEDDAFVLLAEAEGLHPGHDYIMHGVHARVERNEVPLHSLTALAVRRIPPYLLTRH